jgi:dienelactone hydrolase
VRDAVAYARSLRNVDAESIGLVGISLGAFLALAVAAEEDLRIAAVVNFFGGMPRPLRRVKSLPPMLVLGTDLSLGMLRQASAKEENRSVSWVRAEAARLPFPDHAFAVLPA